MKQYECSLKHWWLFTKEKNYDLFNTDALKVIEFLMKCFQDGAKYGTLNSDRVAISLIISGKFSRDKVISRFMRGIFKKRPTKYATTWNIDPILDYIESLLKMN
jgi:sulfur relay (sulfurtransferase) DsrC/TusE family protein